MLVGVCESAVMRTGTSITLIQSVRIVSALEAIDNRDRTTPQISMLFWLENSPHRAVDRRRARAPTPSCVRLGKSEDLQKCGEMARSAIMEEGTPMALAARQDPAAGKGAGWIATPYARIVETDAQAGTPHVRPPIGPARAMRRDGRGSPSTNGYRRSLRKHHGLEFRIRSPYSSSCRAILAYPLDAHTH